ncbi:MAG: MBL fold metallo-hydrolase [Clostridiaceae bacterium]
MFETTKEFKITTLIENDSDDNDILLCEHGLSLYIEADGKRILFDTGKSGDFIKNAPMLNVDLSNIDYVILSHGHYDHSGGFVELVNKYDGKFNLIMGEKFFNKKYKLTEEKTYRYNGNSFDEKFLHEKDISTKYISEDIIHITENIIIFSNFERKNNFEVLNSNFVVKNEEGYVLDEFSDEIVLGIKIEKGLLVILGCSHIGVMNILETIAERIGMPVYGIIGGTHLIQAEETRLDNTFKFIKEKDIKIIGVSHCTGEIAVRELERRFGERFFRNNTGKEIEFCDSDTCRLK